MREIRKKIKNNSMILGLTKLITNLYSTKLWDQEVSDLIKLVLESQLNAMNIEYDDISYTTSPNKGENLFIMIQFPGWKLVWKKNKWKEVK